MIDLPTPTLLIDCFPIVDYRHPISKGLLGFVNPESGGNCKAVVTGAMPVVGSRDGLKFKGSNSASNYATVAGLPKVSPPFTVLARVKIDIDGNTPRAYLSQGGASSGKGWKIGSSNASADQLRLTFGGVADYNFTAYGTSDLDIVWLGLTITANGGTATVYRDGAARGTASVGTMATPASTFLTIGATHNGSSYVDPIAAEASVTNIFLWNRCLSGAEMKYMALDPYACLLKKYDMHTNWAQVTATFKAWLNYHRHLRT